MPLQNDFVTGKHCFKPNNPNRFSLHASYRLGHARKPMEIIRYYAVILYLPCALNRLIIMIMNTVIITSTCSHVLDDHKAPVLLSKVLFR